MPRKLATTTIADIRRLRAENLQLRNAILAAQIPRKAEPGAIKEIHPAYYDDHMALSHIPSQNQALQIEYTMLRAEQRKREKMKRIEELRRDLDRV